MKIRLSIFALACLAVPFAGSATEHEPGAWITFSTKDALQTDGPESRWHYCFDIQARYFDLDGGADHTAENGSSDFVVLSLEVKL